MEYLYFTLKTVAPVFMMVFLGYILKRKGVILPGFVKSASQIAFYSGLPALIFLNIASANLKALFQLWDIVFVYGAIVLMTVVMIYLSKYFKWKPQVRAAFVQGTIRANYAYIGLAVLENIYGAQGLSRGVLLLSLCVPVFNVSSILVIGVCVGSTSPGGKKISFGGLFFNVIKNPLILAVFAALPFSLFNISVPVVPSRFLTYLGRAALPLALLAVGAQINIYDLKKKLKPVVWASLIKVVLIPVVSFLVMLCFHNLINDFPFRGSLRVEKIDFFAKYLLFASPTAVSSFVMAEVLGADRDTASGIVVFTTLFSFFTIGLAVYFFKVTGFIM